MSKEQQRALDAMLRQGQLDFSADVPALRAGFNEVMARVPVPGDIDQKPTQIGGVGGIEVTIRGTDATNVILYFHGGVYVVGSALFVRGRDMAREIRLLRALADEGFQYGPNQGEPPIPRDRMAKVTSLPKQFASQLTAEEVKA